MDNQNPFAAPAETAAMITGSPVIDEMPLASQGKRFLNLILDTIFIQILSFMSGVVLAILGAAEFLEGAGGTLVGFVIYFAYYMALEMAAGKTLGKMVTGTRVVNANGETPTAGQIIGRSFARMIPFEAFSFFGGKGYPVGWHDSLSGTRVVLSR